MHTRGYAIQTLASSVPVLHSFPLASFNTTLVPYIALVGKRGQDALNRPGFLPHLSGHSNYFCIDTLITNRTTLIMAATLAKSVRSS